MDWADKKALELITKYINSHDPEGRLVTLGRDFADALRQSAAEARTRENEKCRELIGARVGEAKYQGA